MIQKRGKNKKEGTDSVGGATAVLAQVFVRNDARSRCNLSLEPLVERSRSRHLSRNLEAVDDSLCIVAFGVGEITARRGVLTRGRAGWGNHLSPEIERRFDFRVCRSDIEPSDGAGTGNVGRHADGRLWTVVAQAFGVIGKGLQKTNKQKVRIRLTVLMCREEKRKKTYDSVNVVHEVGAGVTLVALEEEAGVRVHDRVGRRLVNLPHDDTG
jgi:hypothetical protein